MDELFSNFLITLIVISAIFGILYTFLITRHRERIMMMEKGINSELFVSKNNGRWRALKIGLLFIGIALGLIIGGLLESHLIIEEGVFYIAMITFFGGLGLLSYFFIEKKFRDNE
ncbi:MAG: hypothetical protein BM557_09145 [Flavobacterium sp. MedPE-SWcel]|uniref:DUF6249 domain-containing protein n=1 Tax=uncultured Flavobacterium sp. TaxID=165435 RepID=UPI00091A6F81|nr:DUF6249 domain-containing protein [uncultured Flavobacterium sp.]OIQ16905.1 MAG: hypothetical protein BM557_09145 [Flavobacterium sp. MedPE-SWcel]